MSCRNCFSNEKQRLFTLHWRVEFSFLSQTVEVYFDLHLIWVWWNIVWTFKHHVCIRDFTGYPKSWMWPWYNSPIGCWPHVTLYELTQRYKFVAWTSSHFLLIPTVHFLGKVKSGWEFRLTSLWKMSFRIHLFQHVVIIIRLSAKMIGLTYLQQLPQEYLGILFLLCRKAIPILFLWQ